MEKIKEIPSDLLKNIEEMENLLEKTWKDIPPSHRTLIDTLQNLCENLRNDLPKGKDLGGLDIVITEKAHNVEELKKELELYTKLADEAYRKITPLDWALKALRPPSIVRWEKYYQRRDRLREQLRTLEKQTVDKPIHFQGKAEFLGLLKIMGDSDQTKFKAYMDNIGKGVTAMTSISNAVQQELQMNAQYYNSLLSLQKGGMDSLNKNIQTAIHNMRT